MGKEIYRMRLTQLKSIDDQIETPIHQAISEMYQRFLSGKYENADGWHLSPNVTTQFVESVGGGVDFDSLRLMQQVNAIENVKVAIRAAKGSNLDNLESATTEEIRVLREEEELSKIKDLLKKQATVVREPQEHTGKL